MFINVNHYTFLLMLRFILKCIHWPKYRKNGSITVIKLHVTEIHIMISIILSDTFTCIFLWLLKSTWYQFQYQIDNLHNLINLTRENMHLSSHIYHCKYCNKWVFQIVMVRHIRWYLKNDRIIFWKLLHNVKYGWCL